jgi:uncharacterized protein
MITLQIVSFESCGKTALCAGIGKKLINAGQKVGYIKPVNVLDGAAKEQCDDAVFINGALELGEEKGQMCPFQLSQEELWRNLSEDTENFSAKLKSSCDRISAGKDILIVESPGSLKDDQVSALACYTIADKVGSRVLLLLCYSNDFRNPEIVQIIKKLGVRLVGIVLNHVPLSKLDVVKSDCEAYFKSQDVRVLGVLPESRALLGVSIGEIASAVGGDIASSREKAGELVENVMLGAMTPDSAKDYYSRKPNKAVILRSERPDMMLAALETSTKCLIVTKQKPSFPVMVKAEDKKVPVIIVNKDISEVISSTERVLAGAKFLQTQKLAAFVAILDSGFDFKTLCAALAI